jgi:hypothetical protein
MPGSAIVSPFDNKPAAIPVSIKPDNTDSTGKGNATNADPLIQAKPNTETNPITNAPNTLLMSKLIEFELISLFLCK